MGVHKKQRDWMSPHAPQLGSTPPLAEFLARGEEAMNSRRPQDPSFHVARSPAIREKEYCRATRWEGNQCMEKADWTVGDRWIRQRTETGVVTACHAWGRSFHAE